MSKNEYTLWQEETVIASRIGMADDFMSRFRGLMLKESLADGEGLFLKNCPSIHCFFMRFPIDVLYLDREMRVIGKETVKPWHIGKSVRGARHVLELAEGRGNDLAVGKTIELKEGQNV